MNVAVRPSLALVVAAAACVASCDDAATLPPSGQIVLYVDTNAPVPLAPGERAPKDSPLALFDRLSVDFFAPGESIPCDGCSRDFPLDARLLRGRRASVGFVPAVGREGYRARVRIYRTGPVSGPRPRSTLEHVVALPAVGADGIVEISTRLRVEDLGAPVGTLEAPASPERGRPTSSQVGAWEGAKVAACERAPEAGEVCVPGGAFWMGWLENEGAEALVRISPFAIDATEVTVERFRASGLAVEGDPEMGAARTCTFSSKLGHGDRHPVNCISKARALAYCETLGKDLPTEAEFEYVSGGRAGAPFPWGREPPTCDDAVFAREGGPDPKLPYFALDAASRACNRLGIGPAPVKTGARDRLALPGGEVFDLAGNLTEWVKDEGPPCWLDGGVQTNPICLAPRPTDLHTRGGAWADVAAYLEANRRKGTSSEDLTGPNDVGFRCVRRCAGKCE